MVTYIIEINFIELIKLYFGLYLPGACLSIGRWPRQLRIPRNCAPFHCRMYFQQPDVADR